MGVAGQGHIAEAVIGAVLGAGCGAPAVCPACGEPAAPGNRACGRALAGVAPASLGIWL
jgi:hypothetical protein